MARVQPTDERPLDGRTVVVTRAAAQAQRFTQLLEAAGNVDVFFQVEDNRVARLVVIAAEPRELTVVNIVGPLDLDQIPDLRGTFKIPHGVCLLSASGDMG